MEWVKSQVREGVKNSLKWQGIEPREVIEAALQEVYAYASRELHGGCHPEAFATVAECAAKLEDMHAAEENRRENRRELGRG